MSRFIELQAFTMCGRGLANQKEFTMKQHVKTDRQRQWLLLAAAFMLLTGTAFAQDPVNETTGYIQIEKNEIPDKGRPLINAANQGMENKDMDLLKELLKPDSDDRTEPAATEKHCDSDECAFEAHQ